MKISIFSILFILLFTFTMEGQSPDLLKSTGKIPKEFISSSTSKYKKQVQALESSRKKKSKRSKRNDKNKKQFLLESNFEIDNILQSGLVLFNDPASVYVNKVLEKIPSNKSKKRKAKPRAYILNSPAVNAFATDQGIIFITLGLLANLENEAQLAFILCHELIHYHHKHSINKFVHSKNIERGKKDFSFNKNKENIIINKDLFEESLYSRKIEEEADEEGFEIFRKTAYDPSTIPNVFRILYYSYLPFEDIAFEKEFLEDKNYIFPKKLWLENVQEIKAMESKEDKHSSHPASAKRLEKIKGKINAQKVTDKSLYIVGEQEFNSVRNQARYQIPFLNMYNGNYPEAIYTAFLQLNEKDDDLELKKVIGKSLYMHAKFSNYSDEENTSMQKDHKKIAEEIQGESQQVYNLLAEMDHKEATILALRYNWNIYTNHKRDLETKNILNDMFVEFASNFKDLKGFSTTERKIVEATPKKENTTKNEKIKVASQQSKYWKYAFVDELGKQDFVNRFNRGSEKHSKRQKDLKAFQSDKGQREYRKDFRRELKKGKSLGIKKVVVVNPFYLSLVQKNYSGGKVEYIRTEEKQEFFSENLKTVAQKSKIKTEVLDMNNLNSSEVEKFNDIAAANLYFSQQMKQYDLSLTPGYQQEQMNQLAKKYNTPYFLWTGVISMQNKNISDWYWLGASVFFPLTLPFTIANVVTPNYDMFYFALLYDVETGKRSVIKTEFFNKRDSDSMLKSHMYDVYHQLSSTRSK